MVSIIVFVPGTAIKHPVFVLCLLRFDDLLHLLLECFALQKESVLIPDKIMSFDLVPVPLHAAFKQIFYVFVVRVMSEAESSAVSHKLIELGRLIQAKLINSDFFLLALDVIIFFIL